MEECLGNRCKNCRICSNSVNIGTLELQEIFQEFLLEKRGKMSADPLVFIASKNLSFIQLGAMIQKLNDDQITVFFKNHSDYVFPKVLLKRIAFALILNKLRGKDAFFLPFEWQHVTAITVNC